MCWCFFQGKTIVFFIKIFYLSVFTGPEFHCYITIENNKKLSFEIYQWPYTMVNCISEIRKTNIQNELSYINNRIKFPTRSNVIDYLFETPGL